MERGKHRKLRVLLFNQYFPPDRSATSFAAQHAVSALAKRGHDVSVIAGRPSYRPVESQAWRPIRRDLVRDARVFRVGSTAFDRGRTLGRVVNYLSYCLLALIVGAVRRADVVVSMTDPPVAVLVARAIARVNKAPLLYWIQDLHPDMAVAAGLVPDNRLVTWWSSLHAGALRQAHTLVVLGDDMAARVTRTGVRPERVHVVPSGAPLGPAPNDHDRRHPLVGELRGDANFVVMHAGTIGYAGAWETLIEGAGLVAHLGVRLVFVGEGPEERRLRRLAAGKPVLFKEFLPPSEARYFLAAGDMQVVTLRQELTGVLVPSKLYGVLAAGRPVFAVVSEESHVARLVRRHRCGITADPTNPTAVAQALTWACTHPEQLENMSRRARAIAAGFDQGSLATHVARLVEKTTEARGMVLG
jgi:colanic acid biosynthesis glycosyl transferase WcaI